MELADLQPGERVLLVGCGTGLDLEYIRTGIELTAIDITPAMVSRLKKRAKRLGLDVDAQVMDGQNIKFDSSRFDVILIHFVLAVVPDPVKVLREATRVLRPGGRVIILNKFVSDDAKPGMLSRAFNPLAKIIATDLTCKLGPIAAATPELKSVHQEQLGFGGHFKIAVFQKSGATAYVSTHYPRTQERHLVAAPALASAGGS